MARSMASAPGRRERYHDAEHHGDPGQGTWYSARPRHLLLSNKLSSSTSTYCRRKESIASLSHSFERRGEDYSYGSRHHPREAALRRT